MAGITGGLEVRYPTGSPAPALPPGQTSGYYTVASAALPPPASIPALGTVTVRYSIDVCSGAVADYRGAKDMRSVALVVVGADSAAARSANFAARPRVSPVRYAAIASGRGTSSATAAAAARRAARSSPTAPAAVTETPAPRPTRARAASAAAATRSSVRRSISATTRACATPSPAPAPIRRARTAPPATTETPARSATCARTANASGRRSPATTATSVRPIRARRDRACMPTTRRRATTASSVLPGTPAPRAHASAARRSTATTSRRAPTTPARRTSPVPMRRRRSVRGCFRDECLLCHEECTRDHGACDDGCWAGFFACLNGCTSTYCAPSVSSISDAASMPARRRTPASRPVTPATGVPPTARSRRSGEGPGRAVRAGAACGAIVVATRVAPAVPGG